MPPLNARKSKQSARVCVEKDRRKQGSITYFVRLKHPDLNAKGPARQTEEDAHRDKECLVGKAVDDQRARLQRLKQGVPQGEAGTGSVADDRDSPPTAQTPRQMKPRMKLTSSPATPRTPGGTQDFSASACRDVAVFIYSHDRFPESWAVEG